MSLKRKEGTTTTSVSMSTPLVERLREASARSGVPQSRIVANALEGYLMNLERTAQMERFHLGKPAVPVEEGEPNGITLADMDETKPDASPAASDRTLSEEDPQGAPDFEGDRRPLPFKCPRPGCVFEARSKNAKCNAHGVKVVPS